LLLASPALHFPRPLGAANKLPEYSEKEPLPKFFSAEFFLFLRRRARQMPAILMELHWLIL
jgi:hypothetical protein